MKEAARVSNVLVVEDEPRVRQLVAKVLRRRGFVVLEAEHAEAALRLFGGQAPDISLLLTDVVMPGMSGRELADSLCAAHPDLKVIFMSGLGEEELSAHGIGDTGASCITKPFTPDGLFQMVEGVLAR
jgi:two-component system cell cycle sensor histidine kinase/response regulator CckA